MLVITTTGERTAGVWGGLLSTSAQARGAVGCVIDGLTRDVAEIQTIGFPVFGLGSDAHRLGGTLGAMEWGVAIECGGRA